jgi:hypothetical protein
LLEGFYKVRFQVDDAVGRSVMYAHGGSMLGGNSAFAHYGAFVENDGLVTAEITSHRHNEDPNYTSLLEATALAGKRSLRLTAVLKPMRQA